MTSRLLAAAPVRNAVTQATFLGAPRLGFRSPFPAANLSSCIIPVRELALSQKRARILLEPTIGKGLNW